MGVTWIGVSFNVLWEDKLLILEIPKKMIDEIAAEIQHMLHNSMIGVKKLRSLAGRLSWVAGVVPRLRWAVNVVYAVISAVDKDVNDGVEEMRRNNRRDNRNKAALVATKRCSVALRWVGESNLCRLVLALGIFALRYCAGLLARLLVAG